MLLKLKQVQNYITVFHEFIQHSTNMYGTLNSVPGAGDPKASKTDGICALGKHTGEWAERKSLYTSTQLRLTQLLLPKSDARTVKNFLSFCIKNKNSNFSFVIYTRTFEW